ncbi:MAG: penicillin-binding protein activator LpoB [Nitrospirae bacterium]|nr:MAG: penicillin-binding protein activator LpoB [Nitrospirota bacterium]
MKKIVLLLALSAMFFVSSSFADEKPRIGVLRFTNNTHASWWYSGVGTDLQDMLASELVNTKSFQVLERKEIDAVFSELKLGESGMVDERTKSQLGKIKGAKYLVSSTVSAFQEDTSGQAGGFGFMGFNIGGEKKKAYMAVDLKVLDVETGEVIDARTVEATSSSGGLDLSGAFGFFSGNMSKHEKTPVGKAIRGCIIEIADYLQCSLAKSKNDACMLEFKEKEAKRREKTKKSIDLE